MSSDAKRDRFRFFDVVITDWKLRAYSYHVVTRFGEHKAVYQAAASHCARYQFSPEFAVMHVAVEDSGARDLGDIRHGELGDRQEGAEPMLDYPLV
jgi:hypothetical protein